MAFQQGELAEDGWQPARLLPTVGLGRQEEQEQRATSSLLAVMHAVPDFARALLKDLGAPRGRVTTYTEIQLKDAEGRRCIPDGAIVVARGSTKWICLVEVKTGKAELQNEQVSRYLDWAREHELDAVLTISNAITDSVGTSPLAVDKRKLRKVDLFHHSWWRILTEAIVQHRHRGVEDPDQQWLLGELITYLDHEKSGASGFQDMGESWVNVRTAAHNETLRARDPEVRDVGERWEQFIDYLALGLGQDLGRDVTPVRPRGSTQANRLDATVRELAADGCLRAAVKVPDAVGQLEVEANLRTRRVTTSVEIAAPGDGRPATRVRWMLRQLKHAPGDLRVEVRFANARETASSLLREAREDESKLLSASDPKRSPRSFRLALTREMGKKRGKNEGSFVRETRGQAIAFYRDLVQDLKPWRASAPRMPDAPDREHSKDASENGAIEPVVGVDIEPSDAEPSGA